MEHGVHLYHCIIAIAQAYMPDKLKRATAAADERSRHGEQPDHQGSNFCSKAVASIAIFKSAAVPPVNDHVSLLIMHNAFAHQPSFGL